MAFAAELSCPSCGVSIEGVSAHTRSLQCPHCSNWIYLSNNGWAAGGHFEHALDAPSMLQVGRSGKLAVAGEKKRAFVVAGRSRISYEDGYWDEWWLEFEDADHHWLEEDDGSYRLHTSLSLDVTAAPLLAAKVGSNVSIDGEDWFVTERLDATVAGTEGFLPVSIIPGETLVCIDVIGNGNKLSVEASDNDVNITQSRAVSGRSFEWE